MKAKLPKLEAGRAMISNGKKKAELLAERNLMLTTVHVARNY